MLCYRLSVVIVLCCYLCCSVVVVLFYVLIVCTVTLPPGVNPIAVDKYIYLHKYSRRSGNKGAENFFALPVNLKVSKRSKGGKTKVWDGTKCVPKSLLKHTVFARVISVPRVFCAP